MDKRDLWTLSVIQCVLAAIFFLLGFATSHWYDDGDINFGLWESCKCTLLGPTDVERYHGATRAFQIISMVCYLLSAMFLAIEYRLQLQASMKTIVYKVLLHTAVVSHFVSVIVFGVYRSETGWSFDLSATAVTLCALGLALVVLGVNYHNRPYVPSKDECGAFLIILAAIFFLLSFATSHWYDDGEVSFGLWESCNCTTLGLSDVEEYHGATRAFQIISMTFYILSAMFCKIHDTFETSVYLPLICFGIAVLSHFISVIVFAIFKSGASWSFALSVTALALCVLSILGKVYCKTDNHPTTPNTDSATGMQNQRAQHDSPGQTVTENSRRVTEMNQTTSVLPPDMATDIAQIGIHNADGSFGGEPIQPTAPYMTDTPPPSYRAAMAGHTRSGQRVIRDNRRPRI